MLRGSDIGLLGKILSKKSEKASLNYTKLAMSADLSYYLLRHISSYNTK